MYYMAVFVYSVVSQTLLHSRISYASKYTPNGGSAGATNTHMHTRTYAHTHSAPAPRNPTPQNRNGDILPIIKQIFHRRIGRIREKQNKPVNYWQHLCVQYECHSSLFLYLVHELITLFYVHFVNCEFGRHKTIIIHWFFLRGSKNQLVYTIHLNETPWIRRAIYNCRHTKGKTSSVYVTNSTLAAIEHWSRLVEKMFLCFVFDLCCWTPCVCKFFLLRMCHAVRDTLQYSFKCNRCTMCIDEIYENLMDEMYLAEICMNKSRSEMIAAIQKSNKSVEFWIGINRIYGNQRVCRGRVMCFAVIYEGLRWLITAIGVR